MFKFNGEENVLIESNRFFLLRIWQKYFWLFKIMQFVSMPRVNGITLWTELIIYFNFVEKASIDFQQNIENLYSIRYECSLLRSICRSYVYLKERRYLRQTCHSKGAWYVEILWSCFLIKMVLNNPAKVMTIKFQ